MTRTSPLLRRAALATTAALAVAALAACSSDDAVTRAGTTPPASATASPTAAAATGATSALTLADPWVKAAASGMTAAFGTLRNTGGADVVVTAASTRVASAVELHETVKGADGAMTMRPKEGGFTVPAGGEVELAPGGNHLMIMGLKSPLAAGETVPLTLTLADGGTIRVEAVVKDFTGAQENYAGSPSPAAGHSTGHSTGPSGGMTGGMTGMDMGGGQ